MAQLIHGTTINGHIAIHAGNMSDHSIATTSYVTTQINNLINGAPGALNTLDELAAALGDDASFATSVTNSLGGKLSLTGGTMTGAIVMSGTQQIKHAGYSGIEYYNAGAQWQGYIGTENNTGNLRYNSYSGSHTWYANNVQKMGLDSSGNLSVTGTLSASGYNASNWNTAYGWGNHASAGYLTSLPAHNHDGRYLLLSGGTLTGDLLSTHPLYPGYNNGAVGSQGSYYLYGDTGNSGIRTNGNFLANGDIYLGTRGNWLSTYLNQAVRTDSAPSFSSVYLGGSQLTGTQVNGLSNMLGVTTLPYSCDITVGGDPDRFYAVQFWGGDQDVWRRIIIKRGYGETAPWDPIGTGVHHGGLLLDWEGNFGGWGGAEYADRLRVFNESYTNVCADMFIYSHSMGYVFMLRGGGAVYHLFSDQPINGFYQNGAPDILLSSGTLSYDDNWSGTNQYDVYAPAPLGLASVNSSRIDGLRLKKQSLLDGRYLIQGSDISGISTISATNFRASNAFYLNGTSYYLNSSNGGIYTNARFETASNLFVGGNSYLGNASGDETHINDILRVGATDSGDAHFYFGEGGSAGSDYGSHWYWDSGYTFTWNTRNAGTDTALFDYVTNDTTYLNWRRNFHMQNREINYVSQLHFNAGLYLQTYNDRNLIIKGNSSSDAGIEGRNAAGNNVFQIYGSGSDYGFLNGTWAGWDIRKTKNAAMYMNNDNTYYLQTNSTSNFYALNIQGNAVVHAGNIGSQSVTYATTAGSAPNASNLNASYGVTAGAGNGLKFWNGSDSYKIHMGNSAEYHYGPVTDYSIKTNIDSNGATRGFTWGTDGGTPIAALNVGNGNMQIAGTFTASNFSGSSSGTNTGDQTNISGNAGTVTHNASRTDGARYNIGWFAGNPSPAYSCDAVQIRSSDGTVFATSYRGSGNVAGTGEAIHAPAGLYSTGTNWLYGTIYMNNNIISEVGNITMISNVGIQYSTTHWIRPRDSSGNLHIKADSGGIYLDADIIHFRAAGGSGDTTISGGVYSGNISGNAATATNVAWTGVTSRPTALSQFTNDLGNYGGWITGYTETIGTNNTSGVAGAKYQINDTWLRVNSDNRQFQIYGNARSIIYRTDGATNDHGGGGYPHIFYYGGSTDGERIVIFGTDGDIYVKYAGSWLSTLLAAKSNTGHTHDDRYYTETEVNNFFSAATAITGYSKSNWDAAYNKRPTAISFSGTGTKTLTLTQGDGSTLTANFSDIDTDTNTDGQTLSINGSTLSISGGNSITIPSGGISQGTADSLYVNVSGDTMTGPLNIVGSSAGQDLFAVNGVYGRLFTVTDDFSDSIFSANTISGLPVIEAFADYSVKIGTFNRFNIVTSGDSVAINSNVVDPRFPFYVGDRSSSTSRYYLTSPGMGFNLSDNYAQFQLYGTAGAYIDFVYGTATDYNGRIMYSTNGEFVLNSSTTIQGTVYTSSHGNSSQWNDKATHRGEGTNYVDYARYVYNNGAYSGTGWNEPSDLGVRYANSAGSVAWTNVSGRPTAISSFTNDSGYITSDTTKLPLSGGTMTGTITITNTDIRSNSTSNWTGDPGTQGKIQYHAARWYIVSDSGSDRIVQFRRNGSDVSHIANDGTFNGNITGTASNITAYTINQSVGTGNSPTFVDVYANEWFRNNNVNEGLYNTATGAHFYSHAATGWTVTGSGGIAELVFRSNHQSTIRGYVYADTSNNIGFLTNDGNWGLQVDASKNVKIFGTDLTVGNSTSSNIYMTDTDETTRRIHCNSGRIGFLTSASGWGAYCDNSGNWSAANFSGSSSGTNTGDQTNISGNAATATNVAASGITGQTGMWTSAARPGAYRLYRNDDNSAYNVQTTWSANISGYWSLRGYNGDTYHAPCYVGYSGYADSAGSASSASSAARATRANGNFYIDDNYGNTVVGVYSASRLQGVFAMGDAYKLAADGSSASNHYGIAWSHPNHGGTAARLTNHGMLVQGAGTTWTAISDSIWCIGDITAFSDARVKANVEVIDNPLERLSKVRGVTFTRIDLTDPTKRYAGVIAQEMREALPEVVTEDGNGELSVSYGNTVSLLIESIKAQQVQIEELKLEVKKLKGE